MLLPCNGTKIDVPINPNCSEVVFRIPYMSKKQALEKLKSVGITEITIEKGDIDSTSEVLAIADTDNPNAPDFTRREWLSLAGKMDENDMSKEKRWSYRKTRSCISTIAQVKEDELHPDTIISMSKVMGEIMHGLTDMFNDKTGKLSIFVKKLEDNPELSASDNKTFRAWYSQFLDLKELYYDNEVPYDVDLNPIKILKTIIDGIMKEKTLGAISDDVHELYPKMDLPSCYFMGSDLGRSNYPTMEKIETVFGGDWHGYDGGSTGDYEDWKETRELLQEIKKLKDMGMKGVDILEKLHRDEYYITGEMEKALKKGEELPSTDIQDYQDERGKMLRAKYVKS